MNSVYKKSVPEGVLDAPTSSPYSKTTPKGELKSLRNIVAQGNFTNDDHSAFTWALDDTGLLTIDGKGNMPDWDYEYNVPWYSDRNNICSVHISEGVTSIDNLAFSYNRIIHEVHIPDSVTDIGSCAFEGCTSLTEIIIPHSVSIIDRCTFKDCSSLKKIDIPEE